jgi:hypothetical protein
MSTSLFLPAFNLFLKIKMATETINGHFTCDNSYAVYVGTQAAVVTKVLPATGDGISNSNATQIFTGEDVTFTANSGDYFYLIAWSDDSAVQGLIGEFSGTNTIFTGNAAWEVYATGKNYGNGQAPTASEINNHITSANSANAWKATAVGPTNANSSQIYAGASNLKVANISDDANWIWYDSGRNGGHSPFLGFNHDEFLIFRIPAWKMAEALDPDAPEPNPAPTPAPAPEAHNCGCGCAPAQPIICMPVPEKDASFDVIISRVRIVKNSARDGKGEFMLTGYADGVSAVMPGMGSYITLYTNWGWRVMNKYVTTVDVKKDSTQHVPLMAEALLTVSGGMRFGASQELKYLELKPGQRPDAQILTVECIDARSNGNRENVFVLEIEFLAFQK